jgi:hypothetical protein
MIMDLASVAVHGTPIESETARRIWWSLYIADHWCFVGLGIASRNENCGGTCDLPMNDMAFHSLMSPERSSVTPHKPGLWAHMVSLVRLFGPIQDLNRRAAKGGIDTIELDDAVHLLGQQLQTWLDMLPPEIRMSVQNLSTHQRNGLGGLFISLHLSYHHYSTLLYFRFLEKRQASCDSYRVHVACCKHHASNFSNLLHLSRQMKGCEASYPTIGHMTTVSSSVLVHNLLFGELDEIQKAREELNANFEALVELRKYWPTTSAMVFPSPRTYMIYQPRI